MHKQPPAPVLSPEELEQTRDLKINLAIRYDKYIEDKIRAALDMEAFVRFLYHDGDVLRQTNISPLQRPEDLVDEFRKQEQHKNSLRYAKHVVESTGARNLALRYIATPILDGIEKLNDAKIDCNLRIEQIDEQLNLPQANTLKFRFMIRGLQISKCFLGHYDHALVSEVLDEIHIFYQNLTPAEENNPDTIEDILLYTTFKMYNTAIDCSQDTTDSIHSINNSLTSFKKQWQAITKDIESISAYYKRGDLEALLCLHAANFCETYPEIVEPSLGIPWQQQHATWKERLNKYSQKIVDKHYRELLQLLAINPLPIKNETFSKAWFIKRRNLFYQHNILSRISAIKSMLTDNAVKDKKNGFRDIQPDHSYLIGLVLLNYYNSVIDSLEIINRFFKTKNLSNVSDTKEGVFYEAVLTWKIGCLKLLHQIAIIRDKYFKEVIQLKLGSFEQSYEHWMSTLRSGIGNELQRTYRLLGIVKEAVKAKSNHSSLVLQRQAELLKKSSAASIARKIHLERSVKKSLTPFKKALSDSEPDQTLTTKTAIPATSADVFQQGHDLIAEEKLDKAETHYKECLTATTDLFITAKLCYSIAEIIGMKIDSLIEGTVHIEEISNLRQSLTDYYEQARAILLELYWDKPDDEYACWLDLIKSKLPVTEELIDHTDVDATHNATVNIQNEPNEPVSVSKNQASTPALATNSASTHNHQETAKPLSAPVEAIKAPRSNYILRKATLRDLFPEDLFKANLYYEALQEIMAILKKSNIKFYIVGGAVRDACLKKSFIDVDLVVECDQLEHLQKMFFSSKIVGKIHRNLLVHSNGLKFEISSMSRDNEGRFSIEHDAMKRRITIDSLYFDPDGEAIYDFMNAVADFENRTITMIDDPQKALSESPILFWRILRHVVKYDFKMDPKIIACLHTCFDKMHTQTNLYTEIQKTLTRGYSLAIMKALNEYRLLEKLSPSFAKVFKDPTDPLHKFIVSLLCYYDNEIKISDWSCRTPNFKAEFCLAVILWPEVFQIIQNNKKLQRFGNKIDRVLTQPQFGTIPPQTQDYLGKLWIIFTHTYLRKTPVEVQCVDYAVFRDLHVFTDFYDCLVPKIEKTLNPARTSHALHAADVTPLSGDVTPLEALRKNPSP